MSELQNVILVGLELKGGNVTYNDWDIDHNKPFNDQMWSFKEDIVQINFDTGENSYTVDIGWYPEFNKKGAFIVYVIKDCEWEKPVSRKRVKTFAGLKKCLQEAIDIVDGLTNGAIC